MPVPAEVPKVYEPQPAEPAPAVSAPVAVVPAAVHDVVESITVSKTEEPKPGADGVIVRKSTRPVSTGKRDDAVATSGRKSLGSETGMSDGQRKLLIYGTITAVVVIVSVVMFGGPEREQPQTAQTPQAGGAGHLNPLGSGEVEEEESEPAVKPHKHPQRDAVDDDSTEEPAPRRERKPKKIPPPTTDSAEPDSMGKNEPANDAGMSAEEKTAPSPAMPEPAPVSSAPIKPTMTPPPGGAPAEATAEQTAEFNKAMQRVRSFLASRNVPQAKTAVQAAAPLAISAAQKEEWSRLDLLIGYVDGFWNAVRESVKGLQVGDELKIGNTSVSVVEADQNSLTLHRPGRNERYPLATMPGGIAFMLADRWYDKNNPANKIYLGAFHAVDPSGNPEEARRLWEAATKSGASAADLMPILDGPKFQASKEAAPSSTPEKSPKAALAIAERAYNQKYGPEIRAAGTPEKKLEMADRLLEEGRTSNDPNEKVFLFRKACELVGKVAMSGAISDEIAHDATERALRLIEQGLSEKQLDAVKQLGQSALMGAPQVQGRVAGQAGQRSQPQAAGRHPPARDV